MDPLVSFANLFYVAAYFVRSVVWLRVFALSGACCLAVYFYTLPQPLMNVVYWNLFYVALNGVWLGRLLIGQREGAQPSPDNPEMDERSSAERRSSWGLTALLAARSR
jgi:hypothetical protein